MFWVKELLMGNGFVVRRGKPKRGEEKALELMNSGGEFEKSIGESGDIGEACWKFLGFTERSKRFERTVFVLLLLLLLGLLKLKL